MEQENFSGELSLSGPFALMSADASRQIAARAAALDLPARRFSPLSNPRVVGIDVSEVGAEQDNDGDNDADEG
jgi:hypothetical protein